MSLATKEGLFASLFVALFIYQIIDGRNRETRLMNFMDKLSEQFGTLATQYEKLAEDVDEIRKDMKDFFRR
jgi:hypothetical protein